MKNDRVDGKYMCITCGKSNTREVKRIRNTAILVCLDCNMAFSVKVSTPILKRMPKRDIANRPLAVRLAVAIYDMANTIWMNIHSGNYLEDEVVDMVGDLYDSLVKARELEQKEIQKEINDAQSEAMHNALRMARVDLPVPDFLDPKNPVFHQ